MALRIGECLSDSGAAARQKVEAEDRTNAGVLARLRALAASLGAEEVRAPDGASVGEWVAELNSTFGK